MSKIKQTWVICRNTIVCTLFQCKLYVALIFSAVLFLQLTEPVKEFSRQTAIKVNGWLFPFMTEYSFVQVTVVLAAAFVFCDIPFDDNGNGWMILRAGRRNWITGKICYVVVMSGIMSVMFYLLSVVLLIPRVTFDRNWGKILGTLAQTNAANQMGLSMVGLDYKLQLSCEPLQACGYALCMMWLIFSMTGLLILVCNLIFKRGVGQIVGMGFALLAFFAPKFSNMYAAYYFSPASWLDISFLFMDQHTGYPSGLYIFLFILTADILLIAGARKVSARYEI